MEDVYERRKKIIFLILFLVIDSNHILTRVEYNDTLLIYATNIYSIYTYVVSNIASALLYETRQQLVVVIINCA